MDVSIPFPCQFESADADFRGARVPQIPCAARENPAMDRRKNELAWQTPALRVRRPEDLRPLWRPSNGQSDTCGSLGQWNCYGLCGKFAKARTMSDVMCAGIMFNTCIKTWTSLTRRLERKPLWRHHWESCCGLRLMRNMNLFQTRISRD
jgi:hypothetical protein